MHTPDLVSCGPFELDVVARELRRGDVRLRLQEQPFQILRLLLARPGAVVTRDELRRQLWADGTFVDFEHSLNAAVKRLRAAIGDEGRAPTYIETVPGRGYRWRPVSRAPGVRLAVLPFTSQDARDDFASGLTDELTAQLGRRAAGRLHLIARTSALACTSATQRASEIGQSLAADYLLEGSVRRHGERARIAVWLVDAREEVQTWRELYDRRVGDPVLAQVELAGAVADAVTDQLALGDRPAKQ